MKTILATIVSLALPVSGTPAPAQTLQDTTVTVFANVNVVPMDSERVLEGHTVVVRGDRIVEVGPAPSVTVPVGATVVEGGGRFLAPGLAEMHGHVPPPNAPVEYTDDVLFLYVANGITTVRGMLGATGQLELRERVLAGGVVAPTLYLAGPSFNGQSVTSAARAEEMVREQKEQGWDLLKIHPGVPRDGYDAMARTAREVGIRFGGHVPQDVGLLHAIESGQETFDHVDGYVELLTGSNGEIDGAALQDAVSRTREAGAWIVPTMALWEVLLGTLDLDDLVAYPELRYMPRNQVEQWTNAYRQRTAAAQYNREDAQRVVANRMKVLRALHEGGVGILMGTDAPQQFSVPGFALHREFERMADAGMSPYEILQSGTANVGRYFADWDDFGTVAAGKRADLVLLESNPLDDWRNLAGIAGVMTRGRWISGEEIEAGLERIAASRSQGG